MGVPIPADSVAKVKESVPAVTAIPCMPTLGHFMPTPFPRGKGTSPLVPKIRLRKLEPEVIVWEVGSA